MLEGEENEIDHWISELQERVATFEKDEEITKFACLTHAEVKSLILMRR